MKLTDRSVTEKAIVATKYLENSLKYPATPAAYADITRALELLSEAKALMEVYPARYINT